MRWSAALAVALAAVPARAQDLPAPAPLPEPVEHRFNLTFRDGEQADSLARALKHLYYNVAGRNAIRDGIRHQEEAILRQPSAKPDPAQAALYAVTLQCESSLAKAYRALLDAAQNLEKLPTPERKALVANDLADADREASRASGAAADAGRRHAAAYRAAGGTAAPDPTGEALTNGVGAARQAIDLARTAAAAWNAGDHEASTLPALEDFSPRLALSEQAGGLAAARDKAVRHVPNLRLERFTFDGSAAGAVRPGNAPPH